jgi:hypothetical protein
MLFLPPQRRPCCSSSLEKRTVRSSLAAHDTACQKLFVPVVVLAECVVEEAIVDMLSKPFFFLPDIITGMYDVSEFIKCIIVCIRSY